MKPNPLPQLILDADPFLRRCGIPYWALAQFRQMRLEDLYLLVDFDTPGLGEAPGTAGVSLTRERGYYRLNAGWLAHLGKNARRRGHLWAWVDFKILPNRKIELIQTGTPGPDNRLEALRLVELVLRRAVLLSRWARRDGDKKAWFAMSPDFFHNRTDSETGALEWLERMRGPALGRSSYPPLKEF